MLVFRSNGMLHSVIFSPRPWTRAMSGCCQRVQGRSHEWHRISQDRSVLEFYNHPGTPSFSSFCAVWNIIQVLRRYQGSPKRITRKTGTVISFSILSLLSFVRAARVSPSTTNVVCKDHRRMSTYVVEISYGYFLPWKIVFSVIVSLYLTQALFGHYYWPFETSVSLLCSVVLLSFSFDSPVALRMIGSVLQTCCVTRMCVTPVPAVVNQSWRCLQWQCYWT